MSTGRDLLAVPWTTPGWYQSKLWERSTSYNGIAELGPWGYPTETGYSYTTLGLEAWNLNFREGGSSLYLVTWRWNGREWVKVYAGHGMHDR